MQLERSNSNCEQEYEEGPGEQYVAVFFCWHYFFLGVAFSVRGFLLERDVDVHGMY